MKRIMMILILVGTALLISSSQVMGGVSYTLITKNGEILDVLDNSKEELSLKKVEIEGDFPESSVNLEEVIKTVMIQDEDKYIHSELSKLKNIIPWKLKEGRKFRFTYSDGVIQVRESPANVPADTKKIFYLYFATIVVAILLSFIGGIAAKTKRKKKVGIILAATALGIAIITTFAVTDSFSSHTLPIISCIVLAFICGVEMTSWDNIMCSTLVGIAFPTLLPPTIFLDSIDARGNIITLMEVIAFSIVLSLVTRTVLLSVLSRKTQEEI